MKYLTNTQVSPLEAEFVETNDPLATSVSTDTLEIKEPSLLVEFENVPVDRITEVIPKMDKLLKRIVAAGPDKFDLERIHNFIDQEVVNSLKEIENSPHLFLPDASVLDMLYGEQPDHLEKFATASKLTNKFRNKNATFWLQLINSTFVNSPKVVVLGKPSSDLVRNLTDVEESRIIDQVEALGKEGLAEKGKILEEAIESQELPGMDVLTKIPLGDVDSIQFRPFESYNRTLNAKKMFDFSQLPFKIHVEDVNSNFVQIYIFMDTTVLNRRQRKFLPLLLDLWLVSPLKKDNVVTPIEAVVKRRTKTLLHIDNGLGFSGSTFSPGAYGDAVIIEAQAEIAKFPAAIDYIGDALNFPLLSGKKVNTTTANILNNIPSLKLSSTDVLRSLSDALYFNSSSNIHHASFLRQKVFLEQVLDDMRTDPEKIINELYEVINKLGRPDNSFIYLATDADQLKDVLGPQLLDLNKIFPNSDEEGADPSKLVERFELKSEYEYRRTEIGKRPRHVAFGVGGTESCFLKQSILYNNTDWSNKEVISGS